jgi:hypothetical protein
MATFGGIELSALALGGNVFGWTADRETSFAVLDRPRGPRSVHGGAAARPPGGLPLRRALRPF